MKKLILSLSLLAASAAPALAHETSFAGARDLDAFEDAELARHDAWLDAVERRELEAQLWRDHLNAQQAERERAWLAAKQRFRHEANVARLEAKQRRRDRAEAYGYRAEAAFFATR